MKNPPENIKQNIKLPKIPGTMKKVVGFQLARILWLKRRFIDNEMKKLSLSRSQWQTLHWLNMISPCSQKELLNYMDVDKAQMARILDEFEKNGYITRTRIPEDRRSLFIELTSLSKDQLIPQLEKTFKCENKILLRGLNSLDQEKLLTLLEKIEKNIEFELVNSEGKKTS